MKKSSAPNDELPCTLRTGSGADKVAEEIAAAHPSEPVPPDDRCLADLETNDLGNGERLRARHGADLMVVDELHRDLADGWFVWDGKRWDGKGGWAEAQKRAHLTARAIEQEAAALERGSLPEPTEFESEAAYKAALAMQKDRIAKLRRWAVSSGNRARISAMLAAAAPYLLIEQEQIDSHPYLLTVANGTLVLGSDSTVRLRPHDRSDRITQLAPVVYDPEAPRPKFEAMLAQLQPDPAIYLFLARWLGYSLTADTGEQLLVCFYGRGANGKSTVLSVLRGVLGDYAITLPFDSFTHSDRRRGGDATPDLVRLPGKRLVMAAEPAVGSRLGEDIIRTQTGGEPVMVRPMFRDAFEFTPKHKIILSYNNSPKIVANDDGTWRRLAIVPWEVTVPADERNPRLASEILAKEASGVLNWMLDGFRMWRERGLDVPEEVRIATEGYRRDTDPIAEFWEACVLQGEGTTMARDFYDSYCRFARANGQDPINQHRFGRILGDRGLAKDKVGGIIVYLGVLLRYDVLDDLGACIAPDGSDGRSSE